MLNKPLYTLTEAEVPEDVQGRSRLLVQLGEGFAGIIRYLPAEKSVLHWSLYQLDGSDSPATWNAVADQVAEEAQQAASITFVHYDAPNTLVPEVLHQPALEQPFLDLLNSHTQGMALYRDPVPQQQAVNVYALPQVVCQQLLYRFPDAPVLHLQSLLLRNKAAVAARITVSVLLKQYHVTVERDDKWLLLRNCRCHTPEDLLYLLLQIMQQWDLSPADTPVVLEGMLAADSAVMQLLEQYIGSISFSSTLQYRYPAWDDGHPPYVLALPDRVLACVS